MKRNEVPTLCCALPSIRVSRRADRNAAINGLADAAEIGDRNRRLCVCPPSTRHGPQPRRRAAVMNARRFS
jgi:hypothetical protein